MLPLLVLIAMGAAQSEVHVVENSGSRLPHSGSPCPPHPADVGDYPDFLLFGAGGATGVGALLLTHVVVAAAAVFSYRKVMTLS
ncbi:hypothetical protein [Streptomyces guryensis]|uniref:Uncharacterized protein n=1 Tax=Streptomyces guryensis TaxID=2886947 RepID=A0A9Q3VME1_9ACTN|nr:hypothetical protein [Streptomyces guryensis]MCD9874702.1 hypothetical protein [Streptomyces guryensis]